jgi:hypothetical protein
MKNEEVRAKPAKASTRRAYTPIEWSGCGSIPTWPRSPRKRPPACKFPSLNSGFPRWASDSPPARRSMNYDWLLVRARKGDFHAERLGRRPRLLHERDRPSHTPALHAVFIRKKRGSGVVLLGAGKFLQRETVLIRAQPQLDQILEISGPLGFDACRKLTLSRARRSMLGVMACGCPS